MRPVDKMAAPLPGPFTKYQKAKGPLLGRLDRFCSYCERRMETGLAVEHIQPKDHFPLLEREWTNFLLACPNCNSCKLADPITPADLLLPDRDNTARAFAIQADGSVDVISGLTGAVLTYARRTIDLVKLDRRVGDVYDENGDLVLRDRIDDRLHAVTLAGMFYKQLLKDPNDTETRELIAETAWTTGFFSAWMRVFASDPDMRWRFIRRFEGTAHACFDNSGAPVASDRLRNTQLAGSGKY